MLTVESQQIGPMTEVFAGKPESEILLRAAEKLGVLLNGATSSMTLGWCQGIKASRNTLQRRSIDMPV